MRFYDGIVYKRCVRIGCLRVKSDEISGRLMNRMMKQLNQRIEN